jgi:nucleotide-binding universal stress UspA family protein
MSRSCEPAAPGAEEQPRGGENARHAGFSAAAPRPFARSFAPVTPRHGTRREGFLLRRPRRSSERKERIMHTFTNIVVATDFSPSAELALEHAVELARRFDAHLYLVHVADNLAALVAPIPSPPLDFGLMQKEVEAAASEQLRTEITRRCAGIRATPVVLTSHLPAAAITGYAKDVGADLIVAGTHGRSGFAALMMGSVAQRLVRTAPCPVLTIRAPEPPAERIPPAAEVPQIVTK